MADNKENTSGPSTAKRAKTSKAAPPSAASKKASGSGHGRVAGSQNYSESELMQLVKLARSVRPISMTGWSKVHQLYNAWAEDNNFSLRDVKPLKARYDKVHGDALVKLTGAGEMPELYRLALDAEDAIQGRTHMGVLDDEPADNEPADVKPVIKAENPAGLQKHISVISISSDDDESGSAKVKKERDGQYMVVKAYHSGAASTPPKKPSSSAKASSARSGVQDTRSLALSLTTALSPAAHEQRDAARFQSQLAAGEIAALREENSRLHDRDHERVEVISRLERDKEILSMQLDFVKSGHNVFDSNMHLSSTPGPSGHDQARGRRKSMERAEIAWDNDTDDWQMPHEPDDVSELLAPERDMFEDRSIKQEQIETDTVNAYDRPFANPVVHREPSPPAYNHHDRIGATVHPPELVTQHATPFLRTDNVAGSSKIGLYSRKQTLPMQDGRGFGEAAAFLTPSRSLNNLPPLTNVFKTPVNDMPWGSGTQAQGGSQ
ncbi:hypothetical protein EWM64_g6550 [Hericium alpestre]|uniref:Uncharacterized protein n=1 Tax=Hericium alpestre TaxID=135208 RepID=A0A4Y9ZUE6_9AGAM|nr:hypothetical protein EWM64_g6550 [Hericium alpestre]